MKKELLIALILVGAAYYLYRRSNRSTEVAEVAAVAVEGIEQEETKLVDVAEAASGAIGSTTNRNAAGNINAESGTGHDSNRSIKGAASILSLTPITEIFQSKVLRTK